MSRSRVPLISIVSIAILGVLATIVFGWRPQLGLDLRGGASVVLQPDRKVSKETLNRTISIIRRRVDSLGVGEPDITQQGDGIVVQLPGVKDQERVLKIVGQTAELRFRPVLAEIGSEADAALQAQLAAASTTTIKGATTTTIKGATTTTLNSRIVTVGAPSTVGASATTTPSPVTTTPSVTTSIPPTSTAPASPELVALGGGGRFGAMSVAAQAGSTSAGTATTAKPTSSVAAPSTPAAASVTTSAPRAPIGPSVSAVPAGASAAVTATTPPVAAPITPRLPADLSKTTPLDKNNAADSVILPYGTRSPRSPRYILGPAELTGDVVSDATATPGQLSGWTVDVQFNSKGSKLWDQMAAKYYCASGGSSCTRVAIELDGVVLSAPTINAQQFFGRAQISGNFTSSSSRDLATSLRYGSLPVKLVPQTVQQVSATLGRDSLRAGLLTGGLGLVLVVAYMLFYYRKLGFVVLAGLAVSGALTWTLISFLGDKAGLALSLAGAVGIIVSVGITVDSYVVYFERMRDEVRSGKSMASSADRAFKGAWRTILSADLTSLIGALTLYFLTVGSVRGFAFFLALSTILDMVVSYFFTRPLVSWLAGRGVFGGKATSGPASRGSEGGLLKPSASSAGALS